MANFSYSMQRPETLTTSITTHKGFIPFINTEGKALRCVKNQDGSYLCEESILERGVPFWWKNTSKTTVCSGCDTTEESKRCVDRYMEEWKKSVTQ